MRDKRKVGGGMKQVDFSREYSEQFDKLRKNRVKTSYFKYGPVATNFGQGLVSAMGSLEKCLEKYRKTGNTEYLCDAANYCMFEFMFPQKSDAFFCATDSVKSAGIDGISINEMKNH